MIWIIIYFILGILYSIYRYKKEEKDSKYLGYAKYSESLGIILLWVCWWPVIFLIDTRI